MRHDKPVYTADMTTTAYRTQTAVLLALFAADVVAAVSLPALLARGPLPTAEDDGNGEGATVASAALDAEEDQAAYEQMYGPDVDDSPDRWLDDYPTLLGSYDLP